MSLTKLAEGILAEAKVLDQYVASQGSQQVSFTQDTLLDLPDDLESSRKSIVNLSQSIKRLALGSIGQLLESLFTASVLLCKSHLGLIAPSSRIFSPFDSSIATTSPNTCLAMARSPIQISQRHLD